MRIHIRIITVGGFIVAGALGLVSLGHAQGLQRPVNAEPTPAISLGDLAKQLSPGRDAAGTTRTYTNADLQIRPAPVAPVMPPFPEIAAPTGVLEHPGVPQVAPMQMETGPEQYGVPYWDGVWGFGPADSWFNGRRQQAQRPGRVQFGISGRFSKPSTPADILLGPLTTGATRTGRRSGPPPAASRGGSGRDGSRGSKGR